MAKIKHPGAVRMKAPIRPRLNKRQGLKAYRTGRK